MDASGGVFPTAVRVVMEPALRLIQGDAHQWSEQTRSCPVIRASGLDVLTKLAKALGVPVTELLG